MSTVLRAQLHKALEGWGVDPVDFADDHASLLGAGLLDSLALFNLSMWLEQRLGRPIDPASLDVMTEWDSVASILCFVERHGMAHAATTAQPASAPPAPASATAGAQAPQPDMRYRIVRYHPQYRADVARLLCGLWSPDPALNDAVFHWKYEANPFAGEALIYLALRQGRPVAIRAFCRSAWEAGAHRDPHAVYVADDFVVAEEDRNHGLFNLFTEAALADFKSRGEHLFFSLSAMRVTRLQLLASGSRSVGVLPTIALRPVWLRTVDRLAEALQRAPLLWRVAQRWMPGRSAQRSFALLDAVDAPLSAGELQIEVTSRLPAQELAELIDRLPHDGRLRHCRDERFFAWRYRHPLHSYRVLLARRAGRLTGYIVLQRGLSAFANPRRVNVVDWACEDATTLTPMLVAARDLGRIVDLVTWTSGGAEDSRAFEMAGFLPADTQQAQRGLPCVLVRNVDDRAGAAPQLSDRPLLALASWDLRMAYTSFA